MRTQPQVHCCSVTAYIFFSVLKIVAVTWIVSCTDRFAVVVNPGRHLNYLFINVRCITLPAPWFVAFAVIDIVLVRHIMEGS